MFPALALGFMRFKLDAKDSKFIYIG